MKKAVERKLARKRVTPKKKSAKKKAAPKKAEVKTKVGGKNRTGGKTAGALKKQVRGESQSVNKVAFALGGLGAPAGEPSGDLHGMAHIHTTRPGSVGDVLARSNALGAGG